MRPTIPPTRQRVPRTRMEVLLGNPQWVVGWLMVAVIAIALWVTVGAGAMAALGRLGAALGH